MRTVRFMTTAHRTNGGRMTDEEEKRERKRIYAREYRMENKEKVAQASANIRWRIKRK